MRLTVHSLKKASSSSVTKTCARVFTGQKFLREKKKKNNKKSIPRGLKCSVRLSLYNVCWCVFHIIAYHVKIIID